MPRASGAFLCQPPRRQGSLAGAGAALGGLQTDKGLAARCQALSLFWSR